MKIRVGSVIGWIAAGLVGALNLFAGAAKFFPVAPGSEQDAMMQQMGLSNMVHMLGVIELVSTVLFLIPRTSAVGFVLLVGYLSGALATVLTHGQDGTPLVVALALLTISAYFRNPELLTRLKGQKN